MSAATKSSWTVYLDPKVLTIMVLGFSSGLPLALSGSTLTRRLAESGVDRATIGVFAMVSLPYALKFCWAPLIDRLPVPFLTRRLGQRRSWALLSQFGLLCAIALLGTRDPTVDVALVALAATVVAFFSASQDIVVDAYRVEALAVDKQAAGSAIYVLGYRLGMVVSGAGALYIAEFWNWEIAFDVMALTVLVGVVMILFAPEPASATPDDAEAEARAIGDRLARAAGGPEWIGRTAAWFEIAVVQPFTRFARRDGWILALLFIALYRAGDNVAGQMTQPFYVDLGFTKAEVAGVTKVFGLWAMIVGGLLGGVMVEKLGLFRGLLLGGILQMVSNLGFVALSWFGHDLTALAGVVAVENICAGVATSAFVAYLSSLCDASFSATQYALLSSFFKIGGDTAAATSGYIASGISWPAFFTASTAAALPGLVVLVILARRGAFKTES